jgi:hypothetical protein
VPSAAAILHDQGSLTAGIGAVTTGCENHRSDRHQAPLQAAAQSSSLLAYAAAIASSMGASLRSGCEVQRRSDEAEDLIVPRRIGVGRRIEQLTDEPRDVFAVEQVGGGRAFVTAVKSATMVMATPKPTTWPCLWTSSSWASILSTSTLPARLIGRSCSVMSLSALSAWSG